MYEAWLAEDQSRVFISSPQQPAYFIYDVERICSDKTKSDGKSRYVTRCPKTLEEFKVYKTRMETKKNTIVWFYVFLNGIACTNSFFNFGNNVAVTKADLKKLFALAITLLSKHANQYMPFLTYEMAVVGSIIEIDVQKIEPEEESVEDVIARELASFNFDDMQGGLYWIFTVFVIFIN